MEIYDYSQLPELVQKPTLLVRIDEPLTVSACTQIPWTIALFSHDLATHRTRPCAFSANNFLWNRACSFDHLLEATLTLCMDVGLGLEYVKIVSNP